MTAPPATLIVIAKEPRPGRVKTRLCPPCTPEQAADLAAAALSDTLVAVATTPANRRILALDGTAGPWLPDGFDVVPQCGGALGERLSDAFSHADGPALLVGMDTPQIDPPLLSEALGRLCEPAGTAPDAVLGRALDGGWWALGLRRPDLPVFDGVPMSTDHTYPDQVRRFEELGLRHGDLPSLMDVDTFDDATAVAATAPGTAFAGAVAKVAALLEATP